MKTTVIVLVMIVLSFSITLAQANVSTDDTVCQEVVSTLSSHGVGVGSVVPKGIPYKNEVMNIHLKDASFAGHFILEEKVVTTLDCGAAENPTFNVYLKDVAIIDEVFGSQDPLDMFDEKLSNKEIEIKGTTGSKKIKAGFTKLAIKVVNWFI